MKKKIIATVLLAVMTVSVLGCSYDYATESTSQSTKAETTKETTTEETTEETTEATTVITYETYNILSIQFKVPDTWYYEEETDARYFSPDKNNKNVYLEIRYVQGDTKNLSLNRIESAFESIVESLPSGATSFKIDSKNTDFDGDLFIGKVDYHITKDGFTTQNNLRIIVDYKTGNMYLFGFVSPFTISEENARLFNEIIDSIKLR